MIPRFVALTVAAGVVTCVPLSGQAPPSVWSVEEMVRIGEVEGDEVFSWIGDVTIGPDSLVYFTEPQSRLIHVFDRSGTRVRTLGGSGGGPGEFTGMPGWLEFHGDTLWVNEYPRAIHLLDTTGRELGRVSTAESLTRPSEHVYGYVPQRRLADGSYGAPLSYSPWAVIQGDLARVPYARVTERGQVLDTLALYDVSGLGVQMEGSFGDQPGGNLHPIKPAPAPVFTAHGDGLIAVAPEGADAAFFRLLVIDLRGDTLVSRRVAYQPRPIEPAWRDAFYDEWAERLAQPGPFGQPGRTPERARSLAEEAYPLPPYHPPVSEIASGADRTIWLKREPTRPDVATWEVRDEGGELHGTLSAPESLRLLWPTRSEIWGTITDELDVPYVVSYRVRQTG